MSISKKKRTDSKYILAGYYLAEVYGQSADRGFNPINLRVNDFAEFMTSLANGTEIVWIGGEATKRKSDKSMSERLSWSFLSVIWSKGRKSDAHDRVDMERLAEKFVAKHRALFAEIVLTESGEFPRQKIPVGGQPITLIPKAVKP